MAEWLSAEWDILRIPKYVVHAGVKSESGEEDQR
jgi:hypothetical protein